METAGPILSSGRRAPAPAGAVDILRLAVEQSALELFAAHGIPLVPRHREFDECVDPTPTPASPLSPNNVSHQVALLALTGFVGPELSGNVVLETYETTLRNSNTTLSSSVDWMAELGNQFLGRLKNRLLRDGVLIQRVPPAVIIGQAASLLSVGTGPPLLVLTGERGFVTIWMNCEPSTVRGPEADERDCDVMTEGEMVLF